ncbi:MAG: hypothetical protein AAGC88_10495 [Bacteroidota bacterium]
MKYLTIISIISFLALTSCGGGHSHEGHGHEHGADADHSHGDEGHTHEEGDHAAQEEFTIEEDTTSTAPSIH